VAALERRAGHDPTAGAALAQHRARLRAPGAGRWWRRATLGTAALVAVAVTLAMILIPPEQRARLVTLLSRETPPLIAHRIVVAPLTNHTGDSTLGALGALAADWIAQGLMRTTQFEVVDPRTTFVAGRIVKGIPAMLRDRNEAIAIAEETGSGTVVSGDLFREGDTLRVLMQVIEAGTGKIVRAVEPVSGTVAAPTRLVAALGEHVLAAVASAVDTTSRGFSAALDLPPSYEAYVETSKAWESFFREDFTDVFRRLGRATLLDSTYIAPLLMRAYVETRLANWPAVDTLVRRLTQRSSGLRPAERAVLDGLQADLRGDLWGRLRAARELVRLTPASVEGYTLAATSALMVNRPREALAILARIDPDRGLLLVAPYYWITRNPALHRLGQHRAELESARRGVRRFPEMAYVHLDLLLALAAAGDIPGLRREFPRAPRTDPDPVFAARERSLYVWRELRAHGHTTAAAQWLHEVLTQPAIPSHDSSLAAALVEGDLLAAAGRWTAARARYTAAPVRSPSDPALLGRLGSTAAHLGEREEALRLDRALAELPTPYLFGANTYARARIAAALGAPSQAVELLRRAWAEGRPLAVDNRGYEDVHSDPEFESLRDFIPFQVLMRID
jgi:TolB-like protein